MYILVQIVNNEGLSRLRTTSLREESAFKKFYKKVLDSSSDLTEEPVLPRYRKQPRRYQEGTEAVRFASPENRYRQAYFEVLDYAIREIEAI